MDFTKVTKHCLIICMSKVIVYLLREAALLFCFCRLSLWGGSQALGGGGAEGLEWGISEEFNLRGNNLFLIQTQSLFYDARHFFARVSASRRNKVVLIYVNGGHYGYVHIQLE